MSVNVSILCLGMAVLSASDAFAQGLPEQQPTGELTDAADLQLDPTLRRKYANTSDLPDGLAYYSLLGTLSAFNKEKPSMSLSMTRQNMALNETEARTFLGLLLGKYEALESEIAKSRAGLLCWNGVPRVSGSEVYAALDAADDLEASISATHLSATRSELTPEQQERLDAWIARAKQTTTVLIYDHRKLYEAEGVDPDNIVAMLCS